MRKLLTCFVSHAVLIGASALAQNAPDAELLSRAAANRQADAPAAKEVGNAAPVAKATPAQAAAADLAAQERAAREQLALSQARLDLIVARRQLKENHPREAAEAARRVLGWVATLSDKSSGDEMSLLAEGIIARAGKPVVTIAAAQAEPEAAAAPSAVIQDDLQRRAESAAEIARQYTGARTPEMNNNVNAELLRERALRNQSAEHSDYQPAREIVDRDRLDRRDEQRLPYQAALDDVVKSDELRRRIEVDEARVAPPSWISYPGDWKERIGSRAQYEGGQIARSQGWTDANGREWYAALYDIHDLIYEAPDFQPALSLDPAEQTRITLDREALRQRSLIFNGGAFDLAAGIPLLRFFGGVDDYALRGPKYSREKQEQIVEMIRAFTTQVTEPKIISIPPGQ